MMINSPLLLFQQCSLLRTVSLKERLTQQAPTSEGIRKDQEQDDIEDDDFHDGDATSDKLRERQVGTH